MQFTLKSTPVTGLCQVPIPPLLFHLHKLPQLMWLILKNTYFQ